MTAATPKAIKTLKTNVEPAVIATEFLQHEFRKFFPGQDTKFYKRMDELISKFPSTRGEETFWFIVAGISEGYSLKYVYKRLTDKKFSWSLEKVKLEDITLTPMSPAMNLILEKADWKTPGFVKAWRDNPEHSKALGPEGMRPFPERDFFPIFLHEKEGKLLVFDGMRRTCMAALKSRSDIKAYVGRITNPEGLPMINRDKPLFLRLMYDEIEDKDLKLLDAIKVVMRAYINHHRNGYKVVENVIKKWEKNPKMAKAAEEILEK